MGAARQAVLRTGGEAWKRSVSRPGPSAHGVHPSALAIRGEGEEAGPDRHAGAANRRRVPRWPPFPDPVPMVSSPSSSASAGRRQARPVLSGPRRKQYCDISRCALSTPSSGLRGQSPIRTGHTLSAPGALISAPAARWWCGKLRTPFASVIPIWRSMRLPPTARAPACWSSRERRLPYWSLERSRPTWWSSCSSSPRWASR